MNIFAREKKIGSNLPYDVKSNQIQEPWPQNNTINSNVKCEFLH